MVSVKYTRMDEFLDLVKKDLNSQSLVQVMKELKSLDNRNSKLLPPNRLSQRRIL